MCAISEIYHSTIGKKFVVGLTGLFLCTYLVIHLGGNLLLFKNDGGKAFDTYAEILPNILVIRIIEIVLFAGFILHIITTTILWVKNKQTRPQKYQVNKPQENSTLFSRTMFLTGSIVFIFLVVHMNSFWVPSRFHPEENHSMYALVKEAFSNPVYSIFYVVAMVLLAFHLRHGFQSAFQTFGIKNKQYSPLVEWVGVIFWLLIPLGFASMPVYFLLNSGRM